VSGYCRSFRGLIAVARVPTRPCLRFHSLPLPSGVTAPALTAATAFIRGEEPVRRTPLKVRSRPKQPKEALRKPPEIGELHSTIVPK